MFDNKGDSYAKIVPCLDVKVVDGRPSVVKGEKFVDLKRQGDPVELARRYQDQGADELIFLDITASHEGRKTMVDVARRVADAIDIPFAVGGGISSLDGIEQILEAGADKIGINTAAVKNPDFVKEASAVFGSERITVAVDARRNTNILSDVNVHQMEDGTRAWFELVIYGGREAVGIDAIEWCRRMEELGAGEILLTSMDRDGTNIGYDLPLTKAICEAVAIPVIASGGASTPQHILEAFTVARADSALAAGMFHRGEYTVGQVKDYLESRGIRVKR
ncbi:MAG: imidazole glycerol phosphate synthase subunit HisF [Methanothrix sp.]|uniref:imidazole glycerol phosphate synthase subunit HisF n=1 Tax=Methanothrix sp. TaxID=90426 RepID=UPI003454E97F|nr:imidazole glycerol phosphate synthase subunit HisF [Methanothrix sp.]